PRTCRRPRYRRVLAAWHIRLFYRCAPSTANLIIITFPPVGNEVDLIRQRESFEKPHLLRGGGQPPSGMLQKETSSQLTLLVKSRRPISNAMEVGFSRGMGPVSLALKHRLPYRFYARF